MSYNAAKTEISVQLIGYDIYCDDVKLNDEPIAETNYEVESDGKSHDYYVKAVYQEGEALPSVVYRSGMSSIEDIVVSSEGASVSIYDLNGRIVKSVNATSELETLPVGVYIVNGRKVVHLR